MKELNVSRIQHFSTGDGPGIRTTVFLKGCNLKCPWCHNPENISPHPQTLIYKSANESVSYGKMMTVREIADDVTEDIEFYRKGNGGVTLSGGEPLLQSEGVGELASSLKDRGVSVLIDTAGAVLWERFTDVIDYTDIFYYDYKTADGGLYKSVCGADRELVLSNLKKLIKLGKTVHARIPLIPGFNVSDTDCYNICADLISADVGIVDLLPFHRLGSSKYEAMGLDYAYKNVKPPDTDTINHIKEIYGKYFTVTVE